jgi:hypothetical protein
VAYERSPGSGRMASVAELKKSFFAEIDKAAKAPQIVAGLSFAKFRADWIRTSDLLSPRQAR